MRGFLQDILYTWHTKLGFRLATIYIFLLLLLVLFVEWLPLAYTPEYLDLGNTSLSPLENTESALNHFAGTDALGRDVLANTLYGARTGLSIAVPVMICTTLIGLLTGAYSGYLGNRTKIKISKIIAGSILFILICFYGLYIPFQAISIGLGLKSVFYSLSLLVLLMLFLWWVILPVLEYFRYFRTGFFFPLDSFVLRIIEVLTSIPKLILTLALASFITPSVTILATVLILTYWTGIARLTRAEMLRISQLPYIEAARSLGLTNSSIIWKEALPNLIGPVIVAFSFGVASLLAVESTLSFLGIGLPAATPSWGRLIAGIRSDTSAWWLVTVPGAMLTLTVLSFQIFSYYLLKTIQNKKAA